jgi:pyridoxal phosphate enzyme (YggS family)
MTASSVEEGVMRQQRRLADAAGAAGRSPATVTIVGASKKQSVDAIRRAYAAGLRDFGENYVQELVSKAAALTDLPDLRWHMIGHLQSNKCKDIVGIVHRVHTIDSVKLAEKLNGKLGELSTPRDPLGALIEVNLSGEASKSGCSLQEVEEILEAMKQLPFLEPRGLMTMPPAADPEEARPYFERLATLGDRLFSSRQAYELSMGMSADCEVAIACGATHVRIGTALFGDRPAPLIQTHPTSRGSVS